MPQDAEFPPALQLIVQPGENDIAARSDGERMHVGAHGRRQFQEVWLWGSSYHKATTPTYNVRDHGPLRSTQSLLPSGEELKPHDAAVRMLEIGLVIADEPDRYKVTGNSRNKILEQQKRDRGILIRDENVFRAYIKATDYVQKQAKIFIGCMLREGRLCALKMKIENIFFYREIIPRAIKFYAASIKENEPKPNNDDADATATDHSEDVQMECQPFTSQYCAAENNGKAAFLAFDQDSTLSDEDITSLIEEFEVQRDLDPETIRAVYEIMCNETEGGKPLGRLFPHSALAFFLNYCDAMADLSLGWKDVSRTVRIALLASQMHVQHAGYSL
ncbi:hypothetical protein ACHAP8_005927 [Fusarium lateritium]